MSTTVTAAASTIKHPENHVLSFKNTDPEKLKIIKEYGEKFEGQNYQDWRQQLKDDGYVVVKNVLSKGKSAEYQQRLFKWLTSFNTPLDIDDRETWTYENLPFHGVHTVYSQYALSHEKVVWDIRQEKSIRDVFAKIWGTDELLVSFDGVNINLPGTKNTPQQASANWQHIDQSPFKQTFQCVQGIAQLSNAGEKDGGLIVYPKSHKYFQEFVETQTDKAKWTNKDWYLLTDEELHWFEQVKGIKPYKVIAEAGDLILWDSRTIHHSAPPASDTIRTITYVSYSPAIFADKDSLERKKEALDNWLGTTHWAHDNINPRRFVPTLPNGEVDPRDRKEPLEKPELSDDLLKLAGAIPY